MSELKKLNIDPRKNSPGIELNAQTGVLKFWGMSMPEDTSKLFRPVIEWLNEYVRSPATNTLVEFHILYLNTASLKMFHEILRILDELYHLDNKLHIRWLYHKNDEAIYDLGLDFLELMNLPMELVELDEYAYEIPKK